MLPCIPLKRDYGLSDQVGSVLCELKFVLWRGVWQDKSLRRHKQPLFTAAGWWHAVCVCAGVQGVCNIFCCC